VGLGPGFGSERRFNLGVDIVGGLRGKADREHNCSKDNSHGFSPRK
jgi:hypothetical protein